MELDVLTRDATTGDGVDELVRLVALDLHQLDVELDLGELTRSTGLLLAVVVLLDGLLDRLAVRDLGACPRWPRP